MCKYSKASQDRLNTCDPRLQDVFTEALSIGFDHSIICGHRSEQEQNEAYRTGASKLQYPRSKHNSFPAKAVDAVPYLDACGISFYEKNCIYFAGKIMAIAKKKGVPLRWGGDWNMNRDTSDQTFNDLVHFELI